MYENFEDPPSLLQQEIQPEAVSIVNLLFDFIDIEDVAPEIAAQPEEKVVKWLKNRSLSFADFKFLQPITQSNQRKLEAHTQCRNFASEIQKYTDHNFMEIFNNERPKIVSDFIDSL